MVIRPTTIDGLRRTRRKDLRKRPCTTQPGIAARPGRGAHLRSLGGP